MKLSVPTNWQPDLIESLDKRSIAEIYGKLESDFIGGAHASILLPAVGKKAFRRHISLIHGRGIKFNYLINSSCLSNAEWTHSGQKKIRRLFDFLVESGVDSVTVAVPYLLQLAKKCYPGLKVGVSVAAGINNPVRARYWEGLGADQITLSFVDVNRNFGLLRHIRKAVGCTLQLIANLQCLDGCPFYSYHNVLSSHASQSRNTGENFYVDYCSLSCRYLRLLEPWKFISAGWIRPEDLDYYEESGIDRIKLVDRGMTTEYISSIVQAYTNRRFEGNLLELFPFNIKKYVAFKKGSFWKKAKYVFHPFKADILRLYRYSQSVLDTDFMVLENRKLDGFLSFFYQGGCKANCADCSYCRDTARNALRIAEKPREEALKVYGNFISDIVEGKVFYIKNNR